MFKKKTEIGETKIHKIEKKKKFRLSNVLFVLLSFLLTAGLFLGLMSLENRFSGTVIYTNVLKAKTNIPKNTVITKDNFSQFFELSEVVITDDINGSLKDGTNLYGKKNTVALVPGEIILEKDFISLNQYTDSLKEPVYMAISSVPATLATSAGGMIREGDLINIIISFDNGFTSGSVQERYESQYLMENVYVSQTMTADGTVIKSSDTTSVASIVLVMIEKEDEILLTKALAGGSGIRFSKVIPRDTIEPVEEITPVPENTEMDGDME